MGQPHTYAPEVFVQQLHVAVDELQGQQLIVSPLDGAAEVQAGVPGGGIGGNKGAWPMGGGGVNRRGRGQGVGVWPMRRGAWSQRWGGAIGRGVVTELWVGPMGGALPWSWGRGRSEGAWPQYKGRANGMGVVTQLGLGQWGRGHGLGAGLIKGAWPQSWC